eukprot:8819561-Alexandrium_andersonii.AAC.1
MEGLLTTRVASSHHRLVVGPVGPRVGPLRLLAPQSIPSPQPLRPPLVLRASEIPCLWATWQACDVSMRSLRSSLRR